MLGYTVVPAIGLVCCLLLAFLLPLTSVLIGTAVVVVGAVAYAVRRLW
jgi:APA family basic amino acid/polyamine antiporter